MTFTGKLTEKEDLEKGTVKFSTYTGYMSAAGGVLISIVVLILFAASTGSVVFSDWWLSIWINSLSKVWRRFFVILTAWVGFIFS